MISAFIVIGIFIIFFGTLLYIDYKNRKSHGVESEVFVESELKSEKENVVLDDNLDQDSISKKSKTPRKGRKPSTKKESVDDTITKRQPRKKKQ